VSLGGIGDGAQRAASYFPTRCILLQASLIAYTGNAKASPSASVVFFHCLVNQYFLGWLLVEKDRSRAAPDS
jgi:hypothetical protein